MPDAFSLPEIVHDELVQRRESGYEVHHLEGRLRERPDQKDLLRLLDEMEVAPRGSAWRYEEPSELEAIRPLFPEPQPQPSLQPDYEFSDRVLGGWLGRCAGCNLGKPVENGALWTVPHIRSYLEQAGAYPLRDYFPVLDPLPDGLQLRDNWPETTRGRICGSARDDDIDYTVLGLHVLETYGFDFQPEDVASEWMHRLPIMQTYTAERVAYRNLVYGLRPPETAAYRNPYREWIGAQIRADIFGYVCPGDPRRAAELAFRDASISHVANGIYGEMWAAALGALAFVVPNPREAVKQSVEYIPPNSRLAEAVRGVLDLHARGVTWDEARASIEQHYGHYHWVHTVNNAAVVAAGLLWGDGDFTATIGLTVQGGLDTDSNGATAGSIAGVLTGAARLPTHWIEPLQDRVRSAIFGFNDSQISQLADRTVRLARSVPAH